jgi:hypothetical protein
MPRFSNLKNLLLTLAVFGIVSIAAGTAKADIVVVSGVNNQGTDNVLLNRNQCAHRNRYGGPE